MKIALLNSLYYPYQLGGAERATQMLAEQLAQAGHAVCVITLCERGVASAAWLNGVKVHRLPLRNWFWPYSQQRRSAPQRAAWHLRDFDNAAMARHVARVLDAERPQVLHTNNLAGFSTSAWREAHRRGIPIVHTLHDYYLMCPPSAMYRKGANCEGTCARCSPFAAHRCAASAQVDAAFGVSAHILQRHLESGFFGSARSGVVYNSASAVKAKVRARKERSDGVVFGYLGRICPEKGVPWLLAAFTATARPQDRLIVAGTGMPRYVERMRRDFAHPSVSFAGHVQPASFYEGVDVAVVPSLWHEPFGRTVIEAMAHGVPVIGSRRGGIPEAVEHGVTGVLVDPDDPDSLARALQRVIAEPEWASRMATNAARALARFSEGASLDAYHSAYRAAACAKAAVAA
jgi:glycosyltransferase involved in cell wall biosynthesis